jgi:hypothetical protein
MFHSLFFHHGLHSYHPTDLADAMALVSALAVEKELKDARERLENSDHSDDKSKDPNEVRLEVPGAANSICNKIVTR